MNFSRRVTRCALVAWALYLIVALSAFASHVHSSHEVGAPVCALCLAQTVTGAATVAVTFVLLAPAARWDLQLWAIRAQNEFIAPIKRTDESRGPPAEVFSLTPVSTLRKHFHETS